MFMSRLPGHHSLASACQRLFYLLRGAGAAQTFATLFSIVDDRYLRSFDRKYRIQTSGFILLSNTSFNPARLRDATQYGPVNGWALRRFLLQLNLPRILQFVDLGCGLGRAVILAGEYGFEKVIGVELAPEFCELARQNIANCRPPSGKLSPITILQMDALDFCAQTDADVFFMFRAFSLEFLGRILDLLANRARSRGKPVTIIYSERLLVEGSYAQSIAEHPAFRKTHQAGLFGQAFFVYQSRA